MCVADIWSLGVILYMLVCGVPPFQETNDSETLVMILDCRYCIPEHVSDGCKEWVLLKLSGIWTRRATDQKAICRQRWIADEFLKWWLIRVLLLSVSHCQFMFTSKEADCKFISLVCVSWRLCLLCMLVYLVSSVLFCPSCFLSSILPPVSSPPPLLQIINPQFLILSRVCLKTSWGGKLLSWTTGQDLHR